MLAPLTGQAQQAAGKLRIGTANPQPRTAPQWQAFLARLAELGYREGDNLVFDHVQVTEARDWETAFRDVVARRPDIVIAAGPEAGLTAATAIAGALPIVMIAVDYDPVLTGHVKSLSRPGGTITGVYSQLDELVGKRLEILKEAFPGGNVVTAFRDRASADQRQALQAGTQRLGMQLRSVDFDEQPYDYERAVADTPRDTFLYCASSPFFFRDRAKLAELAIRHRLVAMYGLREFVAAGGLLSYGPSITGMFALAAGYVANIARGARPADMPIEQPTRFELVVNLRTAETLGLKLPATLLARADEQIE